MIAMVFTIVYAEQGNKRNSVGWVECSIAAQNYALVCLCCLTSVGRRATIRRKGKRK